MKSNDGNKFDAVTQAVSGFERRHIGLSSHNIDYMLDVLGESSMAGFIERVVPDSILDRAPLPLQQPLDEPEALKELSQIAELNDVLTSCMGQGYYGCHTPSVLQRNVFENPGWYTCLLYTSPSPRDRQKSRMPSSA